MTAAWTTRVPVAISLEYGIPECHQAYYAPACWPGQGPLVGLTIPEGDLRFLIPPKGEDEPPPAFVNRPRRNHDVKGWLRTACQMAAQSEAGLTLSCDTAAQAERAARCARRWLPGTYARVSLERVLAGRIASSALS